eukprot:scaffold6978_cov64-Phaeocystis_antarctica.AAC.10
MRSSPKETSFGSKNCDISTTLPPPASISFIDESMSTQLSGPLGDCTYWSTLSTEICLPIATMVRGPSQTEDSHRPRSAIMALRACSSRSALMLDASSTRAGASPPSGRCARRRCHGTDDEPSGGVTHVHWVAGTRGGKLAGKLAGSGARGRQAQSYPGKRRTACRRCSRCSPLRAPCPPPA